MRGLGVWLVGFGVTGLVICVFPVAAAGTPGKLLGWLACAGLATGSLLCIGILLVRRAEDRGGSREALTEECPVAPRVEHPGVLDRVRAFDLNRVNWVGWLLLLETFGFVGVEVAAAVRLWELGGWDRRLAKVAALPMLFLAIGFFAGARWLLGRLGVSTYRQEGGRAVCEAPEVEPRLGDDGRADPI